MQEAVMGFLQLRELPQRDVAFCQISVLNATYILASWRSEICGLLKYEVLLANLFAEGTEETDDAVFGGRDPVDLELILKT